MEKKFEASVKQIGTGPDEGAKADLLRARAECQKAELGLAEENARSDDGENNSRETNPPETGQKQETKWTPENIKMDPVSYLSWGCRSDRCS